MTNYFSEILTSMVGAVIFLIRSFEGKILGVDGRIVSP